MTAQGEDILAWTNAAITSRERMAQQTAAEFGSVWTADDDMESVGSDTGADVLDEPSAPRAYIAANDPESVLRRCAADRKLLALHRPDSSSCIVCAAEEQADEDSEGEVSWSRWALPFPCPTVLAVAEGYGWTGFTDSRPDDGAQTSPSKGDRLT